MGKALKEWLRALIGALIILFVLNFFVATTTVINTSMLPTLLEKDMLLLTKISPIERGDIVTFKSHLTITEADIAQIDPLKRLFIKVGQPKILIKRVIGLPGEQIDIQDGKVYIDGNLLDETVYLEVETSGDLHIDQIPQGSYFLMGDNRSLSMDSRSDSVGLVLKEDITGEALFRYFPLNRIKYLKEVYP